MRNFDHRPTIDQHIATAYGVAVGRLPCIACGRACANADECNDYKVAARQVRETQANRRRIEKMSTYRVEVHRGDETFIAEKVEENKLTDLVVKLYEAGWTDTLVVMNDDEEEV